MKFENDERRRLDENSKSFEDNTGAEPCRQRLSCIRIWR